MSFRGPEALGDTYAKQGVGYLLLLPPTFLPRYLLA